MDADDREAKFVSLITEHQLALKLFINSLLPGDAGAPDVAQEVSATVWKKRADFVPGTNFRAWIFQIARNHVANHRRKRAREDGVMVFSDSLHKTITAELADKDTDLEHRLQALRQCLQNLPKGDRELIQHRYFHQTPLKDYAIHVGRTVGTLKVKLHRIRSSLERCVSQQLGTDGKPIS